VPPRAPFRNIKFHEIQFNVSRTATRKQTGGGRRGYEARV